MNDNRQSVRSVERALHLLKCFSFDRKRMSLAELSTASGLPKPTVFRLLVPLEQYHFIKRDEKSQTYSLGIELFQLGQIVQSDLELRRVALPVMEELCEKTGETININILQGKERVCIEKIEGKHGLRQFVEVGKSMTLFRGASGKVLLAFLPKEHQLEIIKDAEEYLGTDVAALRSRLEQIKSDGYAVSYDERVLGAAAVSVPIVNHAGKLVGGLTVSGATVRMTADKAQEYVRLAVDAAKRISKMLGYKDRK